MTFTKDNTRVSAKRTFKLTALLCSASAVSLISALPAIAQAATSG